jgi:hypothetical protein
MRRSTIAALLSALAMPGAGHLYLKRIRSGIALIVVSLGCLWVVLDSALREASAIVNNIDAMGMVDPAQITALVTQASDASGRGLTTLAAVGLAVVWIFGIVDAWRLGRRAD